MSIFSHKHQWICRITVLNWLPLTHDRPTVPVEVQESLGTLYWCNIWSEAGTHISSCGIFSKVRGHHHFSNAPLPSTWKVYLILTTTPSLAQMEATHLFFHKCVPLVKTIPFHFKNKPLFKLLSPPHVKCTQPSQQVPLIRRGIPLFVKHIPPPREKYAPSSLQVSPPDQHIHTHLSWIVILTLITPIILSVGKNSTMLIRGAHPNTTPFHSLWPSSKGNRTGNHRDPFYIPISMAIPHLDTRCAISLLIRLEAKVLINMGGNSKIDNRLWSSYGNSMG